MIEKYLYVLSCIVAPIGLILGLWWVANAIRYEGSIRQKLNESIGITATYTYWIPLIPGLLALVYIITYKDWL